MSKVDKKEAKNPKNKKDLDSKKKVVEDSDVVTPSPSRANNKRTSKRKSVLELAVDHSKLINEKHINISLTLDSDQIHVHKYVIEARCKKLLEAAQTKKQKKGLMTYEMKDIEFSVMNHIIHYLYSDKLNQIDPQECVKVIRSANQLGLERLVQLAEVMLQQSLKIENLFELLKLSHDLHSDRAKRICLEFSVINHSKFIADQRVRDIPIALFQEEAVLHEQLKEKISNGWKPDDIVCNQPSTINEDFRKLLESLDGADATLVISKETIKFHRAFVAHASPKLMDLMDQKDPASMPKEFKHVTSDTFKALLRYIYYRGCDFSPLLATKLISFARQLNMSELVEICETKIRSGIDKSTVLDVLEVSYNPVLKDKEDFQKELKKNCKEFFLDHIKDIDLEPLRSMDSTIGTELLLHVQKSIKSNYTISESDKEDTYQSSTTLEQSEKSEKANDDPNTSEQKDEDKTESSEVKQQSEEQKEATQISEEESEEESEKVETVEVEEKEETSKSEAKEEISKEEDDGKKKGKKDKKNKKEDKKEEKKDKKADKKEEKKDKKAEKKDKKDKKAEKKEKDKKQKK